MAENKTTRTSVSADAYIAAIANEGRRQDCAALARLMATASKQPPRMWGSSIVGFGTYRYPLAGGKVGEICAVGFSSRKGDISIYGIGLDDADPALLQRLGRYKRGKGCLYVDRLADVDLEVLARLVAGAIQRKGVGPTPTQPAMPDPVPSPSRVGQVEIDGVALRYTVVGDPSATAPPLLILHGAFMHGEAMAPLAVHFAAERRVILLDQRAHGRSGDSTADAPLTYAQLGDDAARVVEHLGVAQADVLGYSMGGGAALQAAVRHPARVRKLVVLSATYRRDGWYPEVMHAIGAMTLASIAGSPLERDYRRLSPTPDRFARYFERVRALNHEDQDIPDAEVRAMAAPTMVVVGDADGVRPEHAVALFTLRGGGDRSAAATGVLGGVPPARLLVLPAAGHLGLTAMYPEIARHVTAFLNDEPPRPPTWP